MSNLNVRSVTGKDGQPVLFPTGIAFGSGAAGGVNNIGIAGQAGFGVGVCPGPLPSGFGGLSDYANPMSDDYGNYRYSDGSIMVWIPAFYYLWGTGSNGLAVNVVSIRPFSYYADVATANAAGYALHRAFYDGGAPTAGFFVDKYLWSNNGGVASSIKNGIPLSSAVRGSLASDHFSHCTGNGQSPADTLGGAIAVAKSRGNDFFCNSRFNFAALAMLAYAHAQASTSTTYCAWYSSGATNYPKGCTNDALGSTNDAALLFVSDGNGTYNCCKTGSANLFSRTTHNGQNCGVADLAGTLWEVTPGLTSNGTNLYVLKTTARMKNLTGGNAGALDLWGAAGIAALYADLGTSYGALWATAANRATYFGAATQVFSEATSGNWWNLAGLGVPLAAGVGGTNAFGNDGLGDYKPDEMCPISGGGWNYASPAGAWALGLNTTRSNSTYDCGGRSALVLG